MLLTSTSFCQTAIKTQPVPNEGSIVLPIGLVKCMIKDLVRGDSYKEQLIQLDSSIQRYQTQQNIMFQERDTLIKQNKECRLVVDDFAAADAINQNTIKSLNIKAGKYKRQRNALTIFASICLIGLFLK